MNSSLMVTATNLKAFIETTWHRNNQLELTSTPTTTSRPWPSFFIIYTSIASFFTQSNLWIWFQNQSFSFFLSINKKIINNKLNKSEQTLFSSSNCSVLCSISFLFVSFFILASFSCSFFICCDLSHLANNSSFFFNFSIASCSKYFQFTFLILQQETLF